MTDDDRGFTETWQFNVSMALASGALTTVVRPADLSPRWLLRMHLGVGVLGAIAGASVDLIVDEDGPSCDEAEPRTFGSRVAGGLAGGVLTGAASVVGVWVDGAIERGLVRRGVRRPRLWMGVAGAGLSLANWAAQRAMSAASPQDEPAPEGQSPHNPDDGAADSVLSR